MECHHLKSNRVSVIYSFIGAEIENFHSFCASHISGKSVHKQICMNSRNFQM